MGIIMIKITVSGHPGSGTSTLVDGLAKHFNIKSINGGQIFRNAAKSRNLTLVEFGRICEKDESIDRKLDDQLKQHIDGNQYAIVESRLAGWWAYQLNIKSIRIWLSVEEEERAKRVVLREGNTFEQAIKENSKRLKVDNQRYQKMYGVIPEDHEPYTNIIEATDMNAEEVINHVIRIIEVAL